MALLTPQEIAELRDEGLRLAGAGAPSAWEPRCVVRAFATPVAADYVFLVQHWIDLEALFSPLLKNGLPETEEECTVTLQMLGRPVPEEPREIIKEAAKVRAAIQAAFSMSLKLVPPGKPPMPMADDGMGTWLPLVAFLEVQCRKSRLEARSYPVGEAFAVMAAHRTNTGWTVDGETYAWRDQLGESGNRKSESGNAEEGEDHG